METNYRKLAKLFYELEGVTSDSVHHAEENILTHSLQAFNLAKRETDDKELWLAALFHDLGKLTCSEGHEKESVKILKDHGYFNPKVFSIIENHMKIRLYLDGTMRKHSTMERLTNDPWFKEITMVRRYDKMGRLPNKPVYDITNVMVDLLAKTNQDCSLCGDEHCIRSGLREGGTCKYFKFPTETEETKCTEA